MFKIFATLGLAQRFPKVQVVKKNAVDFICYDVLKEYGPTLPAARRYYRAYTHTHVLEDDGPVLDAMRANRFVIGDESFIEKTRKRLQEHRKGAIQDKNMALPTATIDVETVDTYVSRHYRMEPEDLFEHGHRAGAAKFVAVELACRLTGMTGRAVGAHYGSISSAAVSIIRRNIREGRYDVGSVMKRLEATILKDSQEQRAK
jgi:hypothetical protein